MNADEKVLLPCPFCGGRVQFRKALHVSDGHTDAVIHADCGLSDFDTNTTDESVISSWNNRALAMQQAQPPTGQREDLFISVGSSVCRFSLPPSFLLSAICRCLMTMDQPKDLTPEERHMLEEHANTLCKMEGFASWVDAFHGVATPQPSDPADAVNPLGAAG